MSADIQLICIIISFLYGLFIKVLNIFNNKLIKNNNKYLNIISNFIYVYIIVLLYVIIIYKINLGIFHVYFLIIMLFGYYLMSKYVKFIINVINKVLLKFKR